MLKISRQRVDKIAKTDPTFPRPVAVLRRIRVWETADVEKWAQSSGRSMMPWSLFESGGRRMAQVYRHRVRESRPPVPGASVRFTAPDGRWLIGTVKHFDEARAVVEVQRTSPYA